MKLTRLGRGKLAESKAGSVMHLDAKWGQLEAHGLRQAPHSVLGGAVQYRQGQGHEAKDGPDL